jgi:hypothetical protein
MYLDGNKDKQILLKDGDLAIFRIHDHVVQFVRGQTRLMSRFDDDKTHLNTEITEDFANDMCRLIALTHGLDVKNVTSSFNNENAIYFRFNKFKKVRKPAQQA